ncbi:MAG: SpoIIE family protein phosphatase [Myxococcales bacterium]|nr:SpoIIE family protein phosphatase [Myxococcales bacterium]
MGLRVVFRTRPKVGESANGDAGVVRKTEAHTMFAVVDALGHGVVAQAVADRARAALSGAALDRGVVSLIEQAHEALKGTRGAALTLGVYTAGTRSIELAGVGNVQVRSLSRSLPFVAAPGVVGSRVSRVRSTTIELLPNETVLIASDGLPRRTSATLEDAPDADALCEHMLSLAHAHDDATVMLVRMERPQPC